MAVSKAGLPVRIKDINAGGINHALKYSYDLLDQKVRRRHIRAGERDRQLAMVTGATDYQGFSQRDVVIEAVFEDRRSSSRWWPTSKRILRRRRFCLNTSSLPIGDIAQKAQRPQQVIGLHFFSPVEKMPLVEVIPHAGTSPQTVATVVKLAKKLGKTPVVVADKAGFTLTASLRPTSTRRFAC